mmetsp:Transcript_67126/g.176006  ORF Transcript_67126/g.176006 Transcript_67126/m.176006 type:complete len:118 (-) Transcript_67126:193-546(-)
MPQKALHLTLQVNLQLTKLQRQKVQRREALSQGHLPPDSFPAPGKLDQLLQRLGCFAALVASGASLRPMTNKMVLRGEVLCGYCGQPGTNGPKFEADVVVRMQTSRGLAESDFCRFV